MSLLDLMNIKWSAVFHFLGPPDHFDVELFLLYVVTMQLFAGLLIGSCAANVVLLGMAALSRWRSLHTVTPSTF